MLNFTNCKKKQKALNKILTNQSQKCMKNKGKLDLLQGFCQFTKRSSSHTTCHIRVLKEKIIRGTQLIGTTLFKVIISWLLRAEERLLSASISLTCKAVEVLVGSVNHGLHQSETRERHPSYCFCLLWACRP